MTTLVICLFIASILPYIAKIPVAIAMNKLGGYDNEHPRGQQEQLVGFGARALAAHQNGFESLLIFATATLVALVTQNTSEVINMLAITHVISRVIYTILYLVNWSTLRSVIWGVGIICSFSIIWMSIP
jgi:uncharacterized MAPEG superfamily protein